MTSDEGRTPEGAPERSPKAGVGAPSGVDGNGPKRFSVQRKIAIVARLLRGEPLDLVARQTNVSIARLTEWRDRALAGGDLQRDDGGRGHTEQRSQEEIDKELDKSLEGSDHGFCVPSKGVVLATFRPMA